MDATQLAVADRPVVTFEEVAEEGGEDTLEAAFKKERTQNGDEEDPHM